MKVIKNIKELPSVVYGLHFYPGIAEYREPDTTYRIFLNEKTLRDMDPTFAGRPVFVNHVEQVDKANLQAEADGWVIKSFYNEADGKHWAEILLVSDAAKDAFRKGWKLSNAYQPKGFGPGGTWNGVEYQKEVTSAEYEHLSLVDDPRYNESIILSPEQFQKYNDEKRGELKRLLNSKEKSVMAGVFDFFKRTKVEGDDIASMSVKLPKSGKEVTIGQLINEADKSEAGEAKKPESADKEEKAKQGQAEERKGAAPQMANEDHHVDMGGKSMSVKDLKAAHAKMVDCMNSLAEHYAGMKKNDEEMDGGEKDAEKAEAGADKTERNADEDGGEKEAAAQEKKADETKRNDDGPQLDPEKVKGFEAGFGGTQTTKNEFESGFKDKAHFEKLKNAHLRGMESSSDFGTNAGLTLNGLERGRSRYGSGN